MEKIYNSVCELGDILENWKSEVSLEVDSIECAQLPGREMELTLADHVAYLEECEAVAGQAIYDLEVASQRLDALMQDPRRHPPLPPDNEERDC